MSSLRNAYADARKSADLRALEKYIPDHQAVEIPANLDELPDAQARFLTGEAGKLAGPDFGATETDVDLSGMPAEVRNHLLGVRDQ